MKKSRRRQPCQMISLHPRSLPCHSELWLFQIKLFFYGLSYFCMNSVHYSNFPKYISYRLCFGLSTQTLLLLDFSQSTHLLSCHHSLPLRLRVNATCSMKMYLFLSFQQELIIPFPNL